MPSLHQHHLITPANSEAVQSYSPRQQDLRSSLVALSNTTKRGLKWASKVTLRPAHAIVQAWIDYQNGRIMRKRESQVELSSRGSDQYSKPQSGAITKAQLDQAHGDIDKSLELREGYKDRNLPGYKGDNYPRRLNRGWEYQGGEFPWRLERTVQEEENWRGLWILEVKDLWSVNWEKEYRLRGRQWQLNTVSQAHWPFPYKRTLDELRDWLERP